MMEMIENRNDASMMAGEEKAGWVEVRLAGQVQVGLKSAGADAGPV